MGARVHAHTHTRARTHTRTLPAASMCVPLQSNANLATGPPSCCSLTPAGSGGPKRVGGEGLQAHVAILEICGGVVDAA